MGDDQFSVRIAGLDDLGMIRHHELPRDKIAQKISQGEIVLLLHRDQLIGSLWMNYLWDCVPFIDLIIIDAAYRKLGLSHILLGFVEEHFRKQGYTILYSSSQLDEPAAQTWHRHMGFEECGMINGLNPGGLGEVFFRKPL